MAQIPYEKPFVWDVTAIISIPVTIENSAFSQQNNTGLDFD